jgi:hypothetical protein
MECGTSYSVDAYKGNIKGNGYNDSWLVNSGLKIKWKNSITLSAKYNYTSSKVHYNRKVFAYNDASVSISGLAFNNKIFLSCVASNLLSY